jgi:RimJ/RimL family protein N-acetyltransferase/ubiquinone/menaquinone biosynthesis C-methylase UbiE
MKTILVQAKHWLKQDYISQTKDITHMKKVQALTGIISTMLLRTTMSNEIMGFTCDRHERGNIMDIQIDISNIVIETERLILKAFTEADLQDFYAYASIPGVGEMAGWPHHESIETSERILHSFIEEKEVFAVHHKFDRKVIGSLGLHKSWANEDETYKDLKVKEIGYVLSKDYWGKGLMPEAVNAVIDYGFDILGLDAFTCGHFSENSQSRRVIEKCGFRFTKQSEFYAKQLQRSIEDMKYILLREQRKTNPLASYYNNYDENGRLEPKHGQVEFLTTMRFIERYLTPDAKVLEIGAGTGRYSLTLADKGYLVDAVELFPHNIDIFKQSLKPDQKISITQGNALDLSSFLDNVYDITLLLGPMYHLYTDEDKRQAVSEALRVTKPGGVVFVAYCISDGSIVLSGFQRKVFDVANYIKRGKINPETFDTYSIPEDVFELVRKEDIDRLMRGFDVKRLHYISTDLFTNYMRGTVDAMSDEEFALYLSYHFAVCERADMVGVTHHSLDIFRKGN